MKEHIKIFTGTAILANRLSYLLYNMNIPSIIRDEKESGRLAGFGTYGDSSELLIFKSDLHKADKTVSSFLKEISE